MLTYVIIGLMCNNLGCYWAPASDEWQTQDYAICVQEARRIKQYSIMYFDTACMIKLPK